ncbi:hypothetical protein [Fulvivirga lutea]|uniref:Por secretion system C-terminal sorting domain-containing protein n=1 Tax=Fulvivirga lutea TaxID=2810512 RepID=A0A974ZZN1_9BACT|nr:hypothetical protein [Fulvivirga lutea]QSE96321.1 hypothetical protein JR347_11950 [Fulvivirga lutea]
MKNLLVALALIANITAFGSERSKVKVTNDSTAIFKVYYTSPVSNKVRVNIYNEDGKKVFSEIIKNENGFVRPYNMSNLPAGNYKFEIVDNEDVRAYEFAFNNAPANAEGLTVFVNKFSDNKFFLGLGNASNQEVTIKIMDENRNEVYSATENVVSQFSQLFNLEAVKSGVTFKVMSNGITVKEISF